MSHPAVLDIYMAVVAWFKRRTKVDPSWYEVSLSECSEQRKELVMLMHTMLAIVIFGIVVPPLLLLAPVFMWSQFCVLNWLEAKHGHGDTIESNPDSMPQTDTHNAEDISFREKTEPDCSSQPDANECSSEACREVCTTKQRKSSQTLAANLLVQQPIVTFWRYLQFGSWLVGALLMIDLKFSVGPIVLHSGLYIAALVWSLVKMRRAQRKARTLVSTVEFNTHTKWLQASPACQPSVLHELSKSQQLKAFQMSGDFFVGSQHRFQATRVGRMNPEEMFQAEISSDW